MKKSKLLFCFMALALAGTSLAGCNGGAGSSSTLAPSSSSSVAPTWDFSVSLSSPSIFVGETTKVVVTCEKKNEHTFAFTSSDPTKASVDAAGVVAGLAAGEVEITVTADGKAELTHKVSLSVSVPFGATGAFSYAAASYDEKANILGKLEKYALDNHFSGLPLFENGGLVM